MTQHAAPGRLPAALVLLGGLLATVIVYWLYDPRVLSNDGIQYVSGARGLLEYGSYTTPVLVYDNHFWTGQVPAPQTAFPPGYPLLIAAVGLLLGFPLHVAAVIVSWAAMLSVAALLYRRVGGWAGALAGVAWMLNGQGLCVLSVVGSDLIFTALTLLTMDRLARGLEPEGRRRDLWVAGLCMAMALSTRFAGVFLLPIFGLYLGVRFLQTRTRARFMEAVATLLPGTLATVALLTRNKLLVGDFDGGAFDAFVRPWSEVVDQFRYAGETLLGIPATNTTLCVLQVVLLGGAVAVLVWRRPRGSAAWRSHLWPGVTDRFLRICLLFVPLYLGVFLYLAHTRNSIILFPRYLVPAIPPMLALGVSAVRPWLKDVTQTTVKRTLLPAVLGVVYLLGQWSLWPEMYEMYFTRNAVREAEAALDGPAPGGGSLREAILKRLPPEAALLAQPAHPFAWVLDHPTLGPLGAQLSADRWDEPHVHALVQRFEIDWAISQRGLNLEVDPPAFWTEVDAGHRPAWLVPDIETPDVTLYRVLR